jgi:uncharacterized membrane protein
VRTTSGDEQQYDLLTAAVIGALVGASATYLLSRGSKHPASPMIKAAARGAKLARNARRDVRRNVRSAGRGLNEITHFDDIRDYVSETQARLNNLVSDELRDLRKAVARQRKRAGL